MLFICCVFVPDVTSLNFGLPFRAVAMLERNGTLKIANVGDCGVKVIRKGDIAYSQCSRCLSLRTLQFPLFIFSCLDKDLGDSCPLLTGRVTFSTSPQEHYFDCPYQLSSETVGQTFLDATVSYSSTCPRTSADFPRQLTSDSMFFLKNLLFLVPNTFFFDLVLLNYR